MLSLKLESMLNDQIAHELLNSNKYRVCKAWFRKEGYEGFAKFFDSNYKDELTHAEWVQNHIEDRNGCVDIPCIDAVDMNFKSVRDIAALTLAVEQVTTDKLKVTMEQAKAEDDYMVQELMFRMIKEQVEEEDKAQTFLDLVLKGDKENNLLVVDDKYK